MQAEAPHDYAPGQASLAAKTVLPGYTAAELLHLDGVCPKCVSPATGAAPGPHQWRLGKCSACGVSEGAFLEKQQHEKVDVLMGRTNPGGPVEKLTIEEHYDNFHEKAAEPPAAEPSN